MLTAAHTLYYLTLESSNGKTGKIPVTTSAKQTCPECPLKEPCYAGGGPLAILWQDISDGKRGITFDSLLDSVSAFPIDQLWRHNQAGDLPGIGDEIDVESLMRLVAANAGKRGFTYTHKPVLSGPYAESNRAAIKYANDNGFTINLSGNNFRNADDLAALNIGPVVCVLPEEYARKTHKKQWAETLAEYKERTKNLPLTTPAGNEVRVCPAVYLDTNCKDCQLCQRQNRKVMPGFPLHGQKRKRGAAIVAN